MSRVGKKPVDIPSGVTLTVKDGVIAGKGPKGESSFNLPPTVSVKIADGKAIVEATSDTAEANACHGLIRSLIANMVHGLVNEYVKELEIQGVGFKAALQGSSKIQLWLGFSAPVECEIPAGIKVKVDNNTAITISGVDKQVVGDIAARIRSFAPAEPYKGKGVRYKGEHVRRKVGKTVA